MAASEMRKRLLRKRALLRHLKRERGFCGSRPCGGIWKEKAASAEVGTAAAVGSKDISFCGSRHCCGSGKER